MEIIGYIGALIIGATLGLIGGGGSILTVPVMVYILGINPVLATAYSLFVVGSAAMVGAFNNIRKGLVSIKTAIIFAVPAFIAVYLTRLYLVPLLPANLFSIGSLVVTKDIGIMVFFAIIMLLASFSMLRSKKDQGDNESMEAIKYNYPMIGIEGFIIGILTGIVGAGGGFLIIPALVLLAKLPMKLAVGTSLIIISIKSMIGFIGDIQAGREIDWMFLLVFTGFAIVGIFLGGYLSNFISGKKLKKSFGWFVLIMAIYILIRELM